MCLEHPLTLRALSKKFNGHGDSFISIFLEQNIDQFALKKFMCNYTLPFSIINDNQSSWDHNNAGGSSARHVATFIIEE